MVTSVPHRDGPVAQYHRVPWSPQAWGQALYLAGGIPAQLFALLVVLVPWWAAWHRNGEGPRPGALFLLLFLLVMVFLAVPLLTGIQRHRLRATAGVLIPAQPVMPDRLSVRGIVAAARSQATWRQVGYHLLAAPALAAAALTVFGVWLAGILFTFVYVYAWTLYPWSLLNRGQSWPPGGHLARLDIPVDVYLTVAGMALLAAAPWVTAAVATLTDSSPIAVCVTTRARTTRRPRISMISALTAV